MALCREVTDAGRSNTGQQCACDRESRAVCFGSVIALVW